MGKDFLYPSLFFFGEACSRLFLIANVDNPIMAGVDTNPSPSHNHPHTQTLLEPHTQMLSTLKPSTNMISEIREDRAWKGFGKGFWCKEVLVMERA